MKERRGIHPEWRRVLIRLPWLLLIPLGLLVPRFCAGRAGWIERAYSTGLYPYIRDILSRITSLAPFSVAELLLYAALAAVVICLVTCILRVLLGRAPLAAFIKRLLDIAITFGALLLAFYATWGLNYFRVPLKTRLELNVCARPVEELEQLTIYLAERANKLRETLPEDEDGVATLEDGYRAVLDALPEAYAALSAREPELSGRVTRAKSVRWSQGLSWCGITGIYIGLTAEPNVNVDAPAFLLPHTAAHEMAHQLGVASEDEAEFVGYLACLQSEDASVVYAGVVTMLIDCGNALYAQDADRYYAVYESYEDGLKRDLSYQREYWDAFKGRTEEMADRTNDAYLKHNGQESGIKSYGEVVDMLLAYYEQTDFQA